jgi:hypothetical protein
MTIEDERGDERRRTAGAVLSGSAGSATPGRERPAEGEPATVVDGRVGTWDDAARLSDALRAEGFDAGEVEVFYTGPAGRHAQTPIGGDSSADAGAKHAGTGAAVGGIAGSAAGLAVGAALAATPVVGPVVYTAAAVGAFGGALAGGVAATEDGSEKPDSREHPVAKPGGVVVAVRVDRVERGESRAVRTLLEHGAIEVQRGPGHWLDGHWVDFDPIAPRDRIAPADGQPQA